MDETLTITVHDDGTATAKVGTAQQTFPDLKSAVTWAESLLWELEGVEIG